MLLDDFSLKRLPVLLVAVVLMWPGAASAQDAREVRLLEELGVELIERRAAEAAAKAEAEHRARLEEQSRLKAQYQDYLGAARRAALSVIKSKRSAVDAETVASLRGKARVVINEVNDATKDRVRKELDSYYETLSVAISTTPAQLGTADSRLDTARKRLGGRGLVWLDKAAIMYALCTTEADAKVIAGNIQLRENLSKDEADAVDECNLRRLVLGLRPLAIDEKLVACGRDHSSDMRRLGFFAHDSPVAGKKKFTDRAKNFGVKAHGENIAMGYADGVSVTLGWWYSPGHLKNMMNKSWKRIGVGQDQRHYTQLFGR